VTYLPYIPFLFVSFGLAGLFLAAIYFGSLIGTIAAIVFQSIILFFIFFFSLNVYYPRFSWMMEFFAVVSIDLLAIFCLFWYAYVLYKRIYRQQPQEQQYVPQPTQQPQYIPQQYIPQQSQTAFVNQ